MYYEGRRNKNQHSITAHPQLLCSVAVIVSKPKLHEKVTPVDLAVAGDVQLPALLVLHVKYEHGKMPENITTETPPESLNPVPSHHG